ncbi:MAG: InlB B-repeat-containing protein, partial [Alphaproteobacteria bacterium]|nr:InlB B-repeat-containing protein [Alphaproteobacteria bacterium]
IALCPIGTKTINNKFLESCTEEDVGASYDITIYVGTDPFNQAGIGDGTCDRFILREVWGKGWTAVIECGGQVLEEEIIVDYSGTNGFAQDGSVYRNQHYIKYPCDLVFETFLRQMFTSTNYGQMMLDFNEHFVEDLIQQLVTNNSLQWLDDSSVFKTSTGLQKNIFYIHDTNEISYDQIPHHTTLSNFECTNSDCGGVEYDTEFLKKINESCGSGNSGGNSGGGSTPTQYTITYNTNGGSAVSSVNYTVGSGTINLANSSKTGYILDGWYSDSTLKTFVGKSGSSYTPTQSLILYAKWTPVSYSLTYELNGGAVKTENPSTYTIITKTFTLNNPTKNGYEFAGWCDNEDLTENCQTEKTIIQGSTGNKKLYAKWTALTGTSYTVNYYVSDIARGYMGEYDLYLTEIKPGSDNETILLSDLATTMPLPGFEYVFGVAGTSTYGPNEPQSGYVTSTTILPDGNRVIDLYYVRQQYNIDITENGVSAVSVMGEHSSGPYYYGDNIT